MFLTFFCYMRFGNLRCHRNGRAVPKQQEYICATTKRLPLRVSFCHNGKQDIQKAEVSGFWFFTKNVTSSTKLWQFLSIKISFSYKSTLPQQPTLGQLWSFSFAHFFQTNVELRPHQQYVDVA